MPAELLLPLFAVVLAVNALFVGLAIRSLWRGRDGEERASTWTSVPVREDVIARSVAERATAPARQPERDTVAAPEPGIGLEPAPAAAEPEPRGPAAEELAAAEEPEPRGPAVEPDAAARPALDPPATSTPTRTRRRASSTSSTAPGSRRRFALPPLDEDHEKVRRSIETFLGGADTPTAAVPPDPASILTVAVIGLGGGDAAADSSRSRRPRATRADDGSGPVELRAMLERTVRSTARGTDVVIVDRHGRVRVVLPGTGELAAHAYLRRIRAIVEPIAEAAAPPTRVVVATATDLDGSVATARRRADRRFAAALGGRAGRTPGAGTREPDDGSDDPIMEPRAAGD